MSVLKVPTEKRKIRKLFGDVVITSGGLFELSLMPATASGLSKDENRRCKYSTVMGMKK